MGRPPKRIGKGPILPREPGTTYVRRINAKQQRLIGLAIAAWSDLEQAIDELIWTLLGVSIESGRVVTANQDANHKFMMVRGLLALRLTEQENEAFAALLGRAQDIYDARNLFAHGQWVTLRPSNIPAALSVREKLPSDANRAEAVVTRCPPEYMWNVIENMMNVHNAFMTIRQGILRSQTESKPPTDEG